MNRYWTNQTIEAWEQARENGYLIGNSDFIWEEIRKEYHWMMRQMKKRMTQYSGEFPIWLWTEKPDLRRVGHFNGGTHAVSLEIEIPNEQVLLSDFDAWHCVLNDSFLALDEMEWEAFYRKELKMSKEESWERIFHFELLRESSWWASKPHLQGVSGKVDISHVRKVRQFIARGSKV
ncbi:DUF3841 domain-containing protein [Paenibacillus pini]|uniref:DUF3841 domain-containing protein n=1 Tax=Paenibacillus pini JCM 16418 TaxID=1236976 RepID=W7Z2W6_9BACL|nr:DUF3841 domain-containing protein [Paenibacillus pini]GAF08789.1 hypothetical protein JCM16418_2894 [Paenibacillus pini JCM 16418]